MSNYDEIRLLGIGGYGYHGVLASEREEGQPFHVDLTLHVDTSQAARTDELGHTADYSAVARAVTAVIEGEPVNLIETLAARIADTVLGFEVAKVDVTVHKPRAPLGVPFTDVQVRISRTSPTGASTLPAGPGIESSPLPAHPGESLQGNEGVPSRPGSADSDVLDLSPNTPVPVVLGLGGNLGDVRHTLRKAVDDLNTAVGITVTDVSALARTAPVTHGDAVAQKDYLNAVVLAETTLSPRELLAQVNRIEDAHGRVRVERWGDRTLDIDIITYGDVISFDADLTLPHPRASQRAFVLVPWAQVDPSAHIPGEDGGAVAALAKAAPDRDGVRWLALDWMEEEAGSTTAAPKVAPTPAPPVPAAPAQPAPAQPAAAEPAAAQPAAERPAPPPPVPSSPEPPVPASPEPSAAGLPPVSEWLAGLSAAESEAAPEQAGAVPEQAGAVPAVPVQPPSVETPVPQTPAPPAAEAGAPPTSSPEQGVEWLADQHPAPPLSATPQWVKVRREE